VLTFASFPGRVEATNNACERDLRPAVTRRSFCTPSSSI
jgi:transposase